MNPAKQSRAVALALGLWKEGEKCDMPLVNRIVGAQCRHGHYIDHHIPPPDLASPAGADALMTALGNQVAAIHFGAGRCRISVLRDEQIVRFDAHGPNWRLALLDAAYQLLCARE